MEDEASMTNKLEPVFLKEEPSANDLFMGKGHENAANSIKKVIEDENGEIIIGLEGDLGLGKSTVIKIMENKLDDSYIIKTFDVDTHSHSSIKTALIKTLYKDINEICLPDNKEGLEKAKDSATGNLLSYTKDTDSSLKWPIVVFAITIVFSIRYLASSFDALTDVFIISWSLAFGELLFENVEFLPNKLFIFFLGISPLITIPIIHFYNKKNKDNKITFGNIFKRNGIDKITEKMEVTREVGSVELKEALEVFSQVIPNEKTFILIIDNIDRVESRLVKEIWSDLNIISSLSSHRLRVIVPFSEYHIARSLSDSDDSLDSGREYIVKRIPLVFRAPPIITAGWRDQFYKYWDEAIQFLNGKEEVASLIEIWKKPRTNITPRFLKRIINEIASIYISTPETIQNGLSACVYFLAFKNYRPKIDLYMLLSEDFDSFKDKEDIAFWKVSLEKTQKLLNKTYESSKIWSTEIACIHYQSKSEIAESELIIEPLRLAVASQNVTEIHTLRSIIGFDIFFNQILDNADLIECYSLFLKYYNEICESENDESFICTWIRILNIRAEINEVSNYDFKLMKGPIELFFSGFDINQSIFENDLNSLDGLTSANANEELIFRLHDLTKILGVIPKSLKKLEPETYILKIIPLIDDLSRWDIKKHVLDNKSKYMDYISSLDETSIIENDKSIGLVFDIISQTINIDTSDIVEINIADLQLNDNLISMLPYTSNWNNHNFESHFLDLFDENTSGNERLASYLLAYSINIKTENKKTWEIINNNLVSKEFNNHLLPNTLSFLKVSQLSDYLEIESIGTLIIDSIVELLVSNRIHRLSIIDFLNNTYPILSETLDNESKNKILIKLSQWNQHLFTDSFNIEEINTTFLKDVIKSPVKNTTDKVFYYFEKHILDNCRDIIYNPSESMTIIMDYYKENNINISTTLDDDFLDNFTSLDLMIDEDIPLIYSKMLSIFPKKIRGIILSKIQSLFNEESTSNEVRVGIIKKFNYDVKINQSSIQVTRKKYADLFFISEINDWLSSQNIDFSNWEESELNTIISAISDDELFSSLLNQANKRLKTIKRKSNKDKSSDSKE